MIGLLQNSLERINSLHNYYDQELKSITRRASKEMKINRFGYLVDYYFSILAANDKKTMEKDSFKNLEKYVKTYVTIQQPIENGCIVYQLQNIEVLKKVKTNLNIKEASMLFRRYYDMGVIHSGNTLIMLLIRFEEFFSEVLKIIYDLYPQKYLDNKMISYIEIQNSAPNNVRRTILDREIEMLMRDSYSKWFDILFEHKIDLSACETELKQLKELYARRNIIVHNGGIVNKAYLNQSGSNYYKIGDPVTVDEKYLKAAFNCIKIIMFTIVIQSEKLLKKGHIYFEEIFNIAFEELSSKNYLVSRSAFYLLMNHPKLSDEYHNMSRINFWISEKETGLDRINEIKKFDVSALENRFKLAKLILLEEYEEANEIIEEEIDNNQFSVSMFEWPLFIHYIKSNSFTNLKNNKKEFFELNIFDANNSSPNDIKIVGSSIKKEVEESKKDEKK